MKRSFIVILTLFLAISASAQAPANYYNSASGLIGDQLKVALHNIIKGHTSITYKQIWDAFWSTDNKGNGVVWDMYSDRPNGTPPYTYYLGQNQCGQYDSEGDCYNREHSWPQSWFNDQTTPRTDLHHIFATDGFVNNQRNNYPFGEVQSSPTTWVSQNGSKLGPCKTAGYSGKVFEPIDEYKGDFARAIMYMSVRYYGEDSSWGNSEMTTKSVIKPWAIAMLLRWNELDPVSQKEINRNNVIYSQYQHNRNPFVDHPEYARMIWDPSWSVASIEAEAEIECYPNPARRGSEIKVDLGNQQVDHMTLCDLSGRVLMSMKIKDNKETFILSDKLQSGFYFLHFYHKNRVVVNKKLLII